MGQFITCINIKVEHGYYANVPRNFHIQPTRNTVELMRRRGMLLRPTESGWQWIMVQENAGFLDGDEFEFSFLPMDANFVWVTRLCSYDPQSFYRLVLTGGKQVIDVAAALAPQEERKTQSEFCRLCIRPTQEMIRLAKDGIPQEYVLQFRVAAYRWEYLFVIRNPDFYVSQHLVLEEARGRIAFEKMQKLENSPFGEYVWRTVSTKPIECERSPDYKIELSDVISDIPLKKRTLNRFVPFPQPGVYLSDQRDCIRQVCYV